MNRSRKAIKLRGTVTSGVGQSSSFTELDWVKEQFINKLGIRPSPGTFNIEVVAEDTKRLEVVRESGGVTIVPGDTGFCTGRSLPVLVSGKVRGAAVIPLVDGYPRRQLEIISEQNIKQALSLEDGDQVEVEVYL